MNQYRTSPQLSLGIENRGIWVDNFCGGGGASTGIEAALGHPVDIAINHDAQAISMHKVNHPQTKHYPENVFNIDPKTVAAGRPIDGVWLSPDCRHFSRAKGGIPVNKKIRGLAWIAIRWALAGARDLYLENVGEFRTWGPLITGADGKDRPCPERRGQTFKAFTDILSGGIETDHPCYLDCLAILGISRGTLLAQRIATGFRYNNDWRQLSACDYGIPTSRKRLFLLARGGDHTPQWPTPTHGPGLKPYIPAADIIDWSIPCPSIFERNKPLAENTLRRIARGIERFVINNPTPFIVRIGQTGFGGDRLQYPLAQPLTTITSKAEHCLVAPVIERQFSGSAGNSAAQPLGTITAGGGGKSALVAAFLAKHFTGVTGVPLSTPFPTITAKGCQNQIVTSHIIKLRGTCKDGQPVTQPLPTITAGGRHLGEVRAFLLKYYSTGGQWQSLDAPLHTVSSKARLGLVTVAGEDYQIVDIGMRMLAPHELYAAQGFKPNYIIDRDARGNKITKTQQIAKCGNSVPPGLAEAVVLANQVKPHDQAIPRKAG